MAFRMGRSALTPNYLWIHRLAARQPPPRPIARFISTDKLEHARETQHKLRAQEIRKRNQSVAMYSAAAVCMEKC